MIHKRIFEFSYNIGLQKSFNTFNINSHIDIDSADSISKIKKSCDFILQLFKFIFCSLISLFVADQPHLRDAVQCPLTYRSITSLVTNTAYDQLLKRHLCVKND